MSEPTIRLSAVDQTKAAFDAVGKRFDGLKKQAEVVSGPLLKLNAALVAIGAAGLVLEFKQAVDAADELGKLSQRIGVSVESLSTLGHAGALADVNLQALGDGLKRLSANMADTQAGTGEALNAFKALNVTVEASPGKLKLTEDILLELAEKFSGFADGANKTALAMKLFGKSGAELVPFLNQGRDGIEALRKEAERLGIAITSKASAQAEAFNDNLTALGGKVRGLANDMAAKFLPSLVQITEQMRLAAQHGGLWATALAGVREAFAQMFLQQSTLAGYGASVDSLSEAITRQLLLIDRLENSPGRRGTRLAIKENRDRAIEAAKSELERLKVEMTKAQTLAQFDTPGGLNPATPKPTAPALPDDTRAKELERLAKERERELGKFNAEVDRARAQAIALEEATAKKSRAETLEQEKELADLRDAYIALADPVEKYRKQLADVAYLVERGALDPTQAAAAVKVIEEQVRKLAELTDEGKKANDTARELGLTFSSAFEDAIVGGKGLREVLRGLEQDLVRIIIRKAAIEPLANAVSEKIKGSSLGQSLGAFVTGLFGGGKAGGGPVFAGTNYLVGEQGPEIFRPANNGAIVPNHAMRGAGSTYNINVNVPAGTSQETALQMAARTAAMLQYAAGYNG
jgi:uncharacterized phage infection (PIP) family protein YhgE